MDELRAKVTQEYLEASKRVREEPQPKPEDAFTHVFADQYLVGAGAARKGAS
jgi:TPP-dependent pyruvate/acetoin dehydrogenase alpha subunit